MIRGFIIHLEVKIVLVYILHKVYLQAGQVRVRLKVKILENALARMAQMWVSRIKQYWTDDRWVRISKPDGLFEVYTIS